MKAAGSKLKRIVKNVVDYRIEGDYQIYTLRHTHIRLRRLMTGKYLKKWANLTIQPNKLVFDNYNGSGYGCNGKYITEELLKRCPELDIVWTVRDVSQHRNEFPAKIRLVEYLSDEAMYEYATAALWVCNIHLVPYLFRGLRKKEGQYYIQTWHGSLGIKKIENDSPLIRRAENWLKMAELNSSYTDYWISNSSFETEVYKRAFWHVRQVVEYGHPRNDILFAERSKISRMVRKRLSLSEEIKTVLYVPTYRENSANQNFDLNFRRVTEALTRKYGGEWKLLIRMHPRNREKPVEHDLNRTQVTDVSHYSDIQELMVLADVMITDYSSAVFDFMLTGKPAFIYAADETDYDTERGLYYPLSATPFPVAENNTQLEQNILNFDREKYARDVAAFLEEKGSVDDGKAAERTVRLIEMLVQQP